MNDKEIKKIKQKLLEINERTDDETIHSLTESIEFLLDISNK